MRTPLAAAAVAAAALLALTACSSSSKDDAKTSPSASGAAPTVPVATSAAPTHKVVPGLPPEPEGAARAGYLAALKAIDPALVANPDKAVDQGRDQCTTLVDGGRNPDHSAAERFSTAGHPLSDPQGKSINAVLRLTLCPKK